MVKITAGEKGVYQIVTDEGKVYILKNNKELGEYSPGLVMSLPDDIAE